MLKIFKHNKETIILNSDDIVCISNVLINSKTNIFYFEIKLKNSFIHTISFDIPNFSVNTPQKKQFIYDTYKEFITNKVRDKMLSDFHYPEEYYYRDIIEDHHYDIKKYQIAVIEYNKLVNKHDEEVKSLQNKIQLIIDNLISELYPNTEIKTFFNTINLRKN